VAELADWRKSARFSPAERLMLELSEATIAWENHRARFNHTFGAESEGYSEGAFCAIPARPSLPAKS